MGRAHAFVSDLDHPELADADRHHLEKVLRLRAGEGLTVSDGAGRWRPCRFGPVLEPVGEVESAERPHPLLTVAFALVKGERPEWTVQKLTEVGVDVIVPFVAARSVVRWEGPKADRSHARLCRVAREAAMQSRRVWLPRIDPLESFAAAAARPGAVMADRHGDAPSLGRTVVLVGPEGGWDDAERATGLPAVGLGPQVLRTETAAVTAGVLWCGLRAGVVHPSGPPERT